MINERKIEIVDPSRIMVDDVLVGLRRVRISIDYSGSSLSQAYSEVDLWERRVIGLMTGLKLRTLKGTQIDKDGRLVSELLVG